MLIAIDASAAAAGFAELSIRNYAEDCATNRIAYLEGWYVEPHTRRLSVGAALMRAAAAHQALGFTETAQIRCFRKGP